MEGENNSSSAPEQSRASFVRWGIQFPWRLAVFGLVLQALLLKLGFVLGQSYNSVAPIWLSSGFALFFVLTFGSRFAAPIAVGAIAASVTEGLGSNAAIIIGLSNALAALICARIFQLSSKSSLAANKISASLLLVLTSSIHGLLNGLLVGVTLWGNAAHVTDGANTAPFNWFLSDFSGTLLLSSLLLSSVNSNAPGRLFNSALSFSVLSITLLASWCVFFTSWGAAAPLMCLGMVAIFAHIDHDRTIFLSALGVAAIATLATINGYGPFVSSGAGLFALQLFLAVLGMGGLLLSAFQEADRRTRIMTATIVFIGSILATLLQYSLLSQAQQRDSDHFVGMTLDIESKLQQRTRLYQDALRGGVSLYAASRDVSILEWKDYVHSLNLSEQYRGIMGLAVVFPVAHAQLDQFVALVREAIDPQFTVRGVRNGDQLHPQEHFILTFVEPIEQNREALGLDAASEKNRRFAAEQARATGKSVMTSTLESFPGQDATPGFILYTPFYKRGMPTGTEAERVANLHGWICARFKTTDFFRDIEGVWGREVLLSIYDGDTAEGRNLNGGIQGVQSFERVTSIDLFGHQLTLGWNKAEGFQYASRTPAVSAGALAILCSLILAIVVGNLSSLQARTEQVVAERTDTLKQSRDLLRAQSESLIQRSADLARARDIAVAATSEKSIFLATMSHEIRTPLTSIIGYADALASEDLPPEEHAAAVAAIGRNGRHLLEVINDTLDFSKIEAGKIEIEVLPVNLFELMHDVERSMKQRAKVKGLELSVAYAFPVPTVIQSDPTRLKQILLNLIGNAIKFTKQGRITVGIRFDSERKLIHFSVEDSGVGMTSEQRERLFGAFSQGDLSTTRMFGGTGLGLMISNDLARRLGGRIEVQSSPSQGSVFTAVIASGEFRQSDLVMDIGAAPVKVDSGKITGITQSKKLQGKVLIAEDGEDNREFIGFLLRKAGLEFEVAENGREAVELAAQKKFDLILMDMEMPEMDGFAATAQLRSTGITIPIIALTANTLKEDRHRCLSSGCTDYVGKPFDQRRFLEKIAWHLTSHPVKEKTPQAVSNEQCSTTTALIWEDPEFVPIIQLFFNRAPSQTAALQMALNQTNWKVLTRYAHSCKGAAANLRLESIREIASHLEESGKREDLAQATKFLADLKGEFKRMEQWWSKLAKPKHASL